MSAKGSPTGTSTAGDVMYFMCEKKSPYTASWTLRRCAFDCQSRYLYYSSKALSLSSPWKKVLKLTAVHVPAEADDFRVEALLRRDSNHTDGNRSERDLYLFTVEGVYRNIMARTAPTTQALPNALTFRRATRGWPTKHSPRGDRFHYERPVTYTWRCDSAALLHAVADTMRDVLADDGLCQPVNEGLPPWDPRNGLPLAHIPLYLGQPFRSLRRSVMYTFERGDLVGRGPDGKAGTAIANGYLCLTDLMVLVMRGDGTVPRWAALRSLAALEYNTRSATVPFLALLTASPEAADMVFLPTPPPLTAEERRAFSGARSVQGLVELLRRLNAFVGGALVVEPEDRSPSVRVYVEERGAHRRPLRFTPAETYREPLVPPLSKARLAQLLARTQPEERGHGPEATAAVRTVRESPVKTFHVGEVGLSRQSTSRGEDPDLAPLTRAEIVAVAPPPLGTPSDAADSDTVVKDGQPHSREPAGGAAHTTKVVDEKKLSDSLEDLIDFGAPPAGRPGEGKGATLDELFNELFPTHPS